jgi:hypothetical protein
MLVRAERRSVPQRASLLDVPGVARFIQNLFGRDEIGGTEALREAIVYRPEVSDRIGGMPLKT